MPLDVAKTVLLRGSAGGARPAKKPGPDSVGARQPGAGQILQPESNRCSGTGSRRAGPLSLLCGQHFRSSLHVCQKNQGQDASGFHGQSTKSAGFPNISQPWSFQPVSLSYRKIYERANSNSGPISWSSAARRARKYLVRDSLTSARFSRPHVNGSWPNRTTTKSPHQARCSTIAVRKRANSDQPVTQALRHPPQRTLGGSARRRPHERIERLFKTVLDLDRRLAAPRRDGEHGPRAPVPPRVQKDRGKWSSAQSPSLSRPASRRHGQGAGSRTQQTGGGSFHPDCRAMVGRRAGSAA